MFNVGDKVIVKQGRDYSITIAGTIGVVSEIINERSFMFHIKSFPENSPTYVYRHLGDEYDLNIDDVELIVNFYGPQLPPVNQKIRTMYARQQAKGILRY